MMNIFNNRVEKASELVEKVWNYEFFMPNKNFINGWGSKKKELSKLFGGELILSKEITVEQTKQAMYRELENYRYELMRTIEKQEWYRGDLWGAIRALVNPDSLYTNKVLKDYDFGEKRKFKTGEKLTRALKKLIDDPKELNRQQVLYSQMMNTRKLTGNLCLSIHPMDFLTMSYTSSWGSCYNVFNYGEHRAGALEFMFSNNTICAYLTTKNLQLPGGYEWNDKKWRSILTVDPDKCIITGKNYPYQSSELAGLAYEWVRELLSNKDDFSEYENVKTLDDLDHYCELNVQYGYNDADYNGDYFRVGVNKNHIGGLDISYGEISCPKCGETGNEFCGESIVCSNCDDSFYCGSCDDRMTGESYTVYNSWGEQIEVCEYCLSEYYQCCDSCGDYHYYGDMTEAQNSNRNCYCQSCAEEKTYTCDECGDSYDDDSNQHKGRTLCEDCYEEALSEEAEKEKEEE